MSTDDELRVLHSLNPRTKPSFPETVEALRPLRERIATTNPNQSLRQIQAGSNPRRRMARTLVGVAAAAVLTATSFAVAGAAGILPPILSARDASAPPLVSNRAQALTPSDEPSAASSETAVATVERFFGADRLSQAKSVVVGKYRFTDDNLLMQGHLSRLKVPRNALVWIVSVNGVPARPATGGMPPLQRVDQLNFVIDANTGKLLVSYENLGHGSVYGGVIDK
jgi:hypothetical protein